MNDSDLLDCIDWCADHISHFGAWPGEFETATGEVLDIDVYLPHIKNRLPSLYQWLQNDLDQIPI